MLLFVDDPKVANLCVAAFGTEVWFATCCFPPATKKLFLGCFAGPRVLTGFLMSGCVFGVWNFSNKEKSEKKDASCCHFLSNTHNDFHHFDKIKPQQLRGQLKWFVLSRIAKWLQISLQGFDRTVDQYRDSVISSPGADIYRFLKAFIFWLMCCFRAKTTHCIFRTPILFTSFVLSYSKREDGSMNDVNGHFGYEG